MVKVIDVKLFENILCLDLGNKTGWALICDKEFQRYVRSGVKKFVPSRFEGGGMKFLRFRDWLDKMHEECDNEIDRIYFEEVHAHTATAAAHSYGGYLAILTSWCEEHNIPYGGVPISHIKKFATGKGNAKKQEIINSIIRRGYSPKDDNEADALAMLLFKIGKEYEDKI